MVTGVRFPVAYVDDQAAAHAFYHGVLGLTAGFSVGDIQFYAVGSDPFGLLVHGGATPRPADPDAAQGSFTLAVRSASKAHAYLKRKRVTILHAPMDMGGGDWWFSVHDPAGNIVGFLGAK